MFKNIESLGFKSGRNGAHSARSMMIVELSLLLEAHPDGAELAQIKEDIEVFNILQKPTSNSRRLTYRHLLDLYGLEDRICLFRVFRKLWWQAPEARAVLALQLALCRDPLLRLAMPLMIETKPGVGVSRQQIEDLLEAHNPGGYSPASKQSFAQNINGSWTQAGFLEGHARKTRVQPQIHAANVAFALFISKLQGFEGQRAFSSNWCKLLHPYASELYPLAMAASSRSYLRYKQSGDIIEVSFPGWLTESEKEQLHG